MLFPSVTKMMSSSILGSRTLCTLSAVTDGRTEQVVVSLRSTATNIGTCSPDRPRLLALPPLLRAFRSRLRSPLRISRTQVSSASTIQFRFGGFWSLCAQKPMSPTKRGGDREIAVLCRIPDRQPISETVPKGDPPALIVKALQSCAGCCVESLLAGLALLLLIGTQGSPIFSAQF